MGQYADMYRQFAESQRAYAKEAYEDGVKKAAEREEKAEAFARTARRFEEIEKRLEATSSRVLQAARERYNANPEMSVRSDDSYSTWTGPLRWDELPPDKQIAYVDAALGPSEEDVRVEY